MVVSALGAIVSLGWVLFWSKVEIEEGFSCGTIGGTVWRYAKTDSGTIVDLAYQQACRDAAFSMGWQMFVPVGFIVLGYFVFIRD